MSGRRRGRGRHRDGTTAGARAGGAAGAADRGSRSRTDPSRRRLGYVLSGSKRYITNAPIAEVFMVFARHGERDQASRDISVFLVPRGAPGLSVGPRDAKMGQHGAWTAEVVLDDVRVPETSLVGGLAGHGTGYLTAMRCLAHGRLDIAALCAGMAQRLLEETVSYALERKQSGRPIAEFQLVQGLIADSQTDVYASRARVLPEAGEFDAGTDTR